ncbi:amino acid ABC transporter substrate-binding protein [Azospirillum brasilense]|uniref:amino acid ABC transporter substrate-binding protein n=1 Tax=Azospirillum brasilense TaxID=192 RepID=UPI000E6A0ADB|nr:amino acid ABC transporter substrate-binding protein [Azospirillum brasilense]NUB28129.1 transporter substrate-binding domain-containing protein [Azospirillum brasilense]NUB33236.1 transporter substrate-binding domain-containing protein [Azospirillum brasilense]RIW00154.1 amino acid ABC transporter substrate-binding protein [Azospirillum brasilense]
MNIRLSAQLGAFVISMIAAPWAQAQSSDGVIDRIRSKGAISIGYRDASIPFSYVDAQGKPLGYSTDICLEVAETVKTALKLPDLQIRMVPVNLQNRIPLVANGTVDISCESAVNTVARQSQVDFSYPFFISQTRLLVKSHSGISELKDLEGKAIALPINSVPERLVRSLLEKDKLNIRVVPVKDNAEGFLALSTNRVDAYSTDDILLFGLRSKAPTPSDYMVVGTPLSYDSYGLLVQKNSTVFLSLVNATLSRMARDGRLQMLYEKWFTPVDVPLSPVLATVFNVIAVPE